MKEIENIIQRYERIDWKREKVALGTVVKVDGSAYRRIGARILVSDNGKWVGGISGGCLEGDALKQAQMAIMKNENSIVVYDTTEDDPHQIGVGLGCNGRIEVLFTPIKKGDNQIEFLKQIQDKRTPTILLQILNINNGKQELRGQFFTQKKLTELAQLINISKTDLTEKIHTILHRRKSKVLTITNTKNETYEILFEIIRPKIKVICVGDNYDVAAFANVVSVLCWEIHIVGKLRKMTKEITQNATKIYPLEAIETIKTDEQTAIVLMSHDFKTDLEILKKIVHYDVNYIGILGPKKRLWKMQTAFSESENSLNLNEKTNLFSPIGLDIGAETPEEIATSIVSEIIAVFRNRNASFLKFRKGSIYERKEN
jgi:xanthine/CO dehydrogenase XdhC/CoxF family maturation factor